VLFEENRLVPPHDLGQADFKQVLESTALCIDIQFCYKRQQFTMSEAIQVRMLHPVQNPKC